MSTLTLTYATDTAVDADAHHETGAPLPRLTAHLWIEPSLNDGAGASAGWVDDGYRLDTGTRYARRRFHVDVDLEREDGVWAPELRVANRRPSLLARQCPECLCVYSRGHPRWATACV